MKQFIAVPILFLMLFACKVNPYRKSNRVYKDQAKVLARQIEEHPLAVGVDSVPASPYWVGTTNFNLRKPNFVIIHHTAQNSCPETLHTFTLRDLPRRCRPSYAQ
jgi:N-acetylmuramoyl-L-alanine amidase